jgi:diacylglycerol O-acyltransferase / wax synthase
VIGSHERMAPGDYLMHRGDKNPRTRSGVMSIELLEHAPDWDVFLETFDRASRVVTRMRQRVVVPAFPTTSPRWVVDPDFDLHFHVRRTRLPEPASHRQLLDFAETIQQSPFDPARPLWEAWLIEGLPEGRAALVTHLSHAVTDGMGGVALFEQIYDMEKDAPVRTMPALPVPGEVSPTDLAREGLSELPGAVTAAARSIGSGAATLALRLARHPRSTAGTTLDYARSVGRVLGSASAAPPSPLLRRRGARTRTVTADLALADLRGAAKALGGSVNDAYLAAVCATLRLYHEGKGVPVHTMSLAIPVSLRTEDDVEGGNHFTGLNIAAPVGETDPARRMRLIHQQVVTGRAEPAIDVLGRVVSPLALLPDVLIEPLAGSVTPADVQASNVPSYPVDTWFAGAKVLAQYGAGPLPGVALMLVMVTRAGRCFVSARYDRDAISDDSAFESALNAGFAEVLETGRATKEPAVKRTRPKRSPSTGRLKPVQS